MNIISLIFLLPVIACSVIVSGHSVEGHRSSLLDRRLDRALDKLISEKHDEKLRRKRLAPPRNYLATDDMADGEREVRLHFTGVSAKQTSVGPEEGSPHGLVLREASDGRQLVYLVYTGVVPQYNASDDASESHTISEDGPHLRLRDCQVVKDPLRVSNFVDAFREESRKAETNDETEDWRSVRFQVLHSLEDVHSDLRPLANFRMLRRQCHRHHKAQKKAARQERRNRHRYSLQDSHKESRLESQPDSPIDDLNNELYANNPAEAHSRARRSLAETFMIPNTQWCGVGNTARSYTHLGGNVAADDCCREHDHVCPYSIPSFQTKYGLTNWSMKTYSHCYCDMRFRTCLKSSNTGAANLVGRVFFDVVATECFVFEKRKVCQSYNWYGTCRKWGVRRQAVLRNPTPWVR